jgi:ribonuclease P protein component
MLKKLNRITKDKEFDSIFKAGKGAYSKVLGMKAISTENNESRFGILVSTKVSKKAVVRNRLKRQIRDILKQNLDNIKPGQDCVVLTLPQIKEADFKQIEEAIIFCLKRLKILLK